MLGNTFGEIMDSWKVGIDNTHKMTLRNGTEYDGYDPFTLAHSWKVEKHESILTNLTFDGATCLNE